MRRLLFCLLLLVQVHSIEAKDDPKFKPTAEEQKILDGINKERAKAKLPELTANEVLFKLARAHSENMAKQDKLDHTLDGKGPAERAKDAGYKGLIGENCAKGDVTDPVEVVKGWMDSKLHRENILRKDFAEIGVGRARRANGVYYYTLVFAIPMK
jgi:uncharacterized protein YkwD